MKYSIDAKMRQYFKGYGFLSFAGNLSKKYGRKLIEIATKAGINTAKTA